MTNPIPIPRGHKEPIMDAKTTHTEQGGLNNQSLSTSPRPNDTLNANSSSTSDMPELSRNNSYSGTSAYSAYSAYSNDDWEATPPERISFFDLVNNLALRDQLEKWQKNVSSGKREIMKQKEAMKSRGNLAKDLVVEEWRRRVPTADEQLDKYRRRMKKNVDKLGEQWNDTKVVTMREKFAFIAGVMIIFISAYLIGGRPEWFHIWYTAQLLYFMPVRFYTYKQRGFHYFLADLCYFVNLLLLLSIWVFPNSKRLFISTYCLAMGNNAIAIAMWRNSLVFHSLDKVTSLFIHIMPCVTLHCIVHCIDPSLRAVRFPALHTILTSAPSSPEHYSLAQMTLWSTLPYAIWQLSYHFLITVRRRAAILAGRPTSFTWLKKSYASTWLGKIVNGLPDYLQEPAFMLIQYGYAVLTMLPCPIWFWYRWASAGFLMAVFMWSVYNGATYYIDVFGNRFQKELENMKKEVAKWQNSPEFHGEHGGLGASTGEHQKESGNKDKLVNVGESANSTGVPVEKIPSLTDGAGHATGLDGGAKDAAKERKTTEIKAE